MYIRRLSACLLGSFVTLPAVLTAGALTYSLHQNGAGWPADARERIDNAMAEAVALYNEHGYFEKHVTANYNPGVPTAHANYDGWIEFGSNSGFQNTRTALHEISHTLGVGTHWNWNNNRSGNTWTGEHAVRQLRHFDGPDAHLSADAQHFWPYGLNQNNEDGAINRVRHIKMVAAMRRDMGIVGQIQGLPADWHMFYFGGSSRIGAHHDTDGDGYTNLEEYLADTDPTDPLDYPGAPVLVHHWLLNETPATAGFAQLDPEYLPTRDRTTSAPLAAATGSPATLVKGESTSDPLPLFSGPAARGARQAEGSTGSLGIASDGAGVNLGNTVAFTQPFTVAFWFNRNRLDADLAPDARQHLFSSASGEDRYWRLHATGFDAAADTFALGFQHHALAGDGLPVAEGLRNDTWYHLTLTRDADSAVRIYLDGEAVFEETFDPGDTGFLATDGSAVAAENVVAYWRFEEGPAGSNVPVAADQVPDSSGNGNHLRTWGTGTAPLYVTDTPFDPVPGTGEDNQLALDFSNGNRDVYSDGKPINSHPFPELTVEASFKANVTNAWQVIVGKDGNPIGGQPPFSLKVRNDGLLEAAIADGGGTRRQIFSNDTVQAGVWYSAVATVTANEMSLWLKGPEDNDYVLQSTLAVDGIFVPGSNAWTVGRGMWGGGVADFFNGLIDEVRVSDVAANVNRVWLGSDATGGEPGFTGLFDDVRVYNGVWRHQVVPLLAEERDGVDYTAWAEAHFGPGDTGNPEMSGPDAIPGLDGVPNLLRYALGLAPGEPLSERIGKPEVNDGRLEITYQRDPNAIGAVVVVEFSEDLKTWFSAGETVVESANGLQTVIARAPAFLGAQGREFVRIRARLE